MGDLPYGRPGSLLCPASALTTRPAISESSASAEGPCVLCTNHEVVVWLLSYSALHQKAGQRQSVSTQHLINLLAG